MKHSDSSDNHVPYAFTYANAAARTSAINCTAADVGKIARQTDDNSLWMLTDDSPLTWVAVGNGAITADSKTYSISGPLEVNTGTLRWYPERTITITKVYYSLGTAGTGTSEIDVKKNGTTIFSTKPSATTGNYKSTEQTVSVSVATTDYVTVDVTQTGAAEDAVVTIVYQ